MNLYENNMSRERYYLEDRLKIPFAGSLKAVESSTMPVIEESNLNQLDKVIEEGDIDVTEAEQLRLRGAVFPLELEESPERNHFFTEREIFNEKGEVTGFDTKIFPYEIAEGDKHSGY